MDLIDSFDYFFYVVDPFTYKKVNSS
uniref:Uncharacterized protein n=1 Tax=Rhizophora mucronata TaxID=61149 RepID=A0A2P2NVD4_RHIMU